MKEAIVIALGIGGDVICILLTLWFMIWRKNSYVNRRSCRIKKGGDNT